MSRLNAEAKNAAERAAAEASTEAVEELDEAIGAIEAAEVELLPSPEVVGMEAEPAGLGLTEPSISQSLAPELAVPVVATPDLTEKIVVSAVQLVANENATCPEPTMMSGERESQAKTLSTTRPASARTSVVSSPSKPIQEVVSRAAEVSYVLAEPTVATLSACEIVTPTIVPVNTASMPAEKPRKGGRKKDRFENFSVEVGAQPEEKTEGEEISKRGRRRKAEHIEVQSVAVDIVDPYSFEVRVKNFTLKGDL